MRHPLIRCCVHAIHARGRWSTAHRARERDRSPATAAGCQSRPTAMTRSAPMHALTVYQPWASLVMIGAKPYEFRRWDYRTRAPALEGQRIVIHAGARAIKPDEIRDLIE